MELLPAVNKLPTLKPPGSGVFLCLSARKLFDLIKPPPFSREGLRRNECDWNNPDLVSMETAHRIVRTFQIATYGLGGSVERFIPLNLVALYYGAI